MENLEVKLTDGRSRLIDDDSWPLVAVSPPLEIRRHSDNSVLIFASFKVNGHESHRGELLQQGGWNLIHAISRVATECNIPNDCVIDCLKQLYNR